MISKVPLNLHFKVPLHFDFENSFKFRFSNYPIAIPERNYVLQKYIQVAQQLDDEFKGRILPKHFIGPNSKTLQMNNIATCNDTLTDTNIRNNYTVTDKADGDRKLLYISGDGKLYLIDTNMNVMFTGTKTKEQTIYNSIIDGEHIKYDKHGKFINLYAAFDIYYVNLKSMRELPFIMRENDTDEINNDRLSKLTRLIEIIKPASCVDKSPTDFQVKRKIFYNNTTENSTIFDGCLKILSNVNDGLFEYNTDGLIFTPAHLPVGGNTEGGPPGPNVKFSWKHSFKWKPPEYNTIDFLVHVTKNSAGNDDVHNIFKDGRNLQGIQNTMSYKTLNLRCGFDKLRDMYDNPCLSLINGFVGNDKTENANENTYVPLDFYPTNPYDDNAHKCNIMLIDDGTKLYMKTEEGEYFEDKMIVEFKYMANNANGWKWVPIRVRNDKTAELNAGLRNYGNSFKVANDNWHSIHNPITNDMITTGKNIPELTNESDDVYYNKTNSKTNTRSLRDFHNLYVKSKLINSVSKRDDILIDYAVGKAGDLSKWIHLLINKNIIFVGNIIMQSSNHWWLRIF